MADFDKEKFKKDMNGVILTSSSIARMNSDEIGALKEMVADQKAAEKKEHEAGIKSRADSGRAAIKGMEEGRMDTMGTAYKKGGKVSSASSRADGCAIKGKTKGRMV
jgi:hypothetical protein